MCKFVEMDLTARNKALRILCKGYISSSICGCVSYKPLLHLTRHIQRTNSLQGRSTKRLNYTDPADA